MSLVSVLGRRADGTRQKGTWIHFVIVTVSIDKASLSTCLKVEALKKHYITKRARDCDDRWWETDLDLLNANDLFRVLTSSKESAYNPCIFSREQLFFVTTSHPPAYNPDSDDVFGKQL
jgi:hypothetical protein